MTKHMRLDDSFYSQSALIAAPGLLGKTLCRRIGRNVIRRGITETECYMGEADTACHASRGKTGRNAIMYSAGGVAYVYLCYGIHNLLNVITGLEGEPEGVLIRGVECLSGPGRLTKVLDIDRQLNGINLVSSIELWIEDDGAAVSYATTPRIGINYASAADRERPWRFIIT